MLTCAGAELASSTAEWAVLSTVAGAVSPQTKGAMPMLVVTGRVITRPETFEVLRDAAVAHSQGSRSEPGCLAHSVHVDCEDPLALFFYEEWSDRPALDDHFARAGSVAFMAMVRDHGAQGTKVRILPIVDRN